MSWQALLLQGVVAVVSTGGLLALLRLGPERRKLSSEAKVQDATAADLLTGRALEMVQAAQNDATAARDEARRARARAESAERRASHAEDEAADLRAKYVRLGRRVEQLTTAIVEQGGTVPPWDRRGDR